MSFELLWPWPGFHLFVIAMLAIDLGIFHRKAHAVSLKEAAIWSGVWITLALIFNAGLYVLRGPDPALQFFTGWLIEKSLSVDNIFVIVLLFTYFCVPAAYQHRVLFSSHLVFPLLISLDIVHAEGILWKEGRSDPLFRGKWYYCERE